MQVDWFTVSAQALNFVILVWLMKRFLYTPILNAIDARERRVAGELADAAARQAEAGQARAEFERKNAEFDQQRAALMTQAAEEAGAERRRLLEEARQAADQASARRQAQLRNDARALDQAIRRETQREVYAIARKVLSDLAGASLEARAADVFVRRVRALDGPAKEGVAETIRTASAPVLVRSAFELPAEQRAAIQAALDETLHTGTPVRFEAAPEVVSGIELVVDGHKVAWSIAGYLASIEQRVGDLLAETTPEHAGGARAVLPGAPVAG
ncbi:MAG: F0F1 ATP synthase subunit B [Acidobacteria bacterium]|nr:F0F1 ATP synthase subunit B [Acidobacteriota bacterium]